MQHIAQEMGVHKGKLGLKKAVLRILVNEFCFLSLHYQHNYLNSNSHFAYNRFINQSTVI